MNAPSNPTRWARKISLVLSGAGLALWLIILALLAGTVSLFFLGLLVPGFNVRHIWKGLPWVILFSVLAPPAVALWRGRLGWLFSRGALRSYLWASALILSLVVLFYSIEKWRGRRAWVEVQREASAKGEKLGLTALVPPAIPDDQNFAKAPIFEPLYEYERTNRMALASPPEAVQRLQSINLTRHSWDWAIENQDLLGNWMLQKTTDLEGWQKDFKGDFTWPQKLENKVGARTAKRLEAAYAAAYHTNQWQVLPAAEGAPPSRMTNDPATVVLHVLDIFSVDLEAIAEASKRPFLRFPSQPSLMAFPIPHSILHRVSQVLRVRASAELALSQTNSAFQDIQTGLRLAVLALQQVSNLSFIECQAIWLNTLQPLWEGLARRRWSVTNLVVLQNQLARLNVLANYPAAWRAAVFWQVDFLNQLYPFTLPAPQPEFITNQWAQWILTLSRMIYPAGWAYQNQAGIYHTYLEQLKVGHVAQERIRQELIRGPDWISLDPMYAMFFAPKIHEMCRDIPLSFALTQTAINQAMLACALERYRLAQGQFPDTLEALVPRCIEKLPHDVINGQPLTYHKTSDGQFVLYSVGWNGVDDGGKPGLHPAQEGPQLDFLQGDWVWKYPSGVGGE